jgi:hypothetical protein
MSIFTLKSAEAEVQPIPKGEDSRNESWLKRRDLEKGRDFVI